MYSNRQPSATRFTTRLKHRFLSYFDRLCLDREIYNKWERDRVALNMDPALRPLHDTIHRSAFRTLARFPNLVHPENFNDRMHWLMLFEQMEEKIECSDKITVRDFIRQRTGETYLAKLYGTYAAASEIDIPSLPRSFVIKTNHDSGSVFPVVDKDATDFSPIRSELDAALRRPYGTVHGEWVYAHITPRILIEEHLTPTAPQPPWDYKFHCIEGRVSFIHFIRDRKTAKPAECVLSPDWKPLPIHLYIPFERMSAPPPTPPHLAEMIEVAEKLASDFKYVRIDLYNIDGRIVAGEMTFYPGAGTYKGYGVYQIDRFMQFSLDTHSPALSDGHRRINSSTG